MAWHGMAVARTRVLTSVEMKDENHLYRIFKLGTTFDASP